MVCLNLPCLDLVILADLFKRHGVSEMLLLCLPPKAVVVVFAWDIQMYNTLDFWKKMAFLPVVQNLVTLGENQSIAFLSCCVTVGKGTEKGHLK